jgi:hypothetical protein
LVPNQARYHLRYTPKENGSAQAAVMVAEEGFEPSQYESESQVLPLHNSAAPSNECFIIIRRRPRLVNPFFRKIPVPESCRTARQAFPALAIPIAFRYNEKTGIARTRVL